MGLTEVVRHSGKRARHVALGSVILEHILDVAVPADDRETRSERVVEASGTNDGV